MCLLYINSLEVKEMFTEPQSGLNRVDLVAFINLDNRPDRLKSIQYQLKNNNIYPKKIKRFPGHYTPKNGHIGCSRSHLDVLEYAQKNHLKNVLILEDDFKFKISPKEINKIFNTFLNKVPNREWDVVFLTRYYGEIQPSKYSFLNKISNTSSGAGYLVNKNYYSKMIENLKESLDNLKEDVFEGHYCFDQLWKKLQEKDNWFVFSPEIGYQDFDMISTTMENLPPE